MDSSDSPRPHKLKDGIIIEGLNSEIKEDCDSYKQENHIADIKKSLERAASHEMEIDHASI